MSKPATVSRLRMFAGPNGSGKSTIKAEFEKKYSALLGIYVNPDEIEAQIRENSFIDFKTFDLSPTEEDIPDFLLNSTLLKKTGLLSQIPYLRFKGSKLHFSEVGVNAYFASVISDFIRQRLLSTGKSLSFETVMSSRDKLEFLEKSIALNYRNYLYFIGTDDPDINISRVKIRVRARGHDVPEDKIRSRYERSMENLLDAIKLTSRAYIYDNSGKEAFLIAEITDGKDIRIENDTVPYWFEKYVISKVRG